MKREGYALRKKREKGAAYLGLLRGEPGAVRLLVRGSCQMAREGWAKRDRADPEKEKENKSPHQSPPPKRAMSELRDEVYL